MREALLWALFFATLGRHYLPDVVAWFAYSNSLRASKALFYVAGGLVGVLLYGTIWHLLPPQPKVLHDSIAMVCAWGMLEEGMVAGCRVAQGIERQPVSQLWRGLCDASTGLPVSTITLVIPVLIVLWWLGKGD